MKIVKSEGDKNYTLNTKKLDIENVPSLNSVMKDILNLIRKEAMYPKQIAKMLDLHEQNVYYYIKKLEKSSMIKVEKQENINGTIANFYKISADSFYFRINEFREVQRISEKSSDFLKPFIEGGELNSIIVVGSPDPHGPQKARSRDGYYGIDFALFLGSFLNFVTESKVKLDTEITDEEIRNNNLIIIGGPIVNKVTGMINDEMPVCFDEEKKGIYSKVTKKTYFNDEIGIVNKFVSPFNETKKILLIAGLRNAGTKAAILSFLKHFNLIKKGNLFDNLVESKVVEGVDLDSDGIVDEVEILE